MHGGERELELPPRPASAAEARQFVGSALGDADAGSREVGVLLASELVTNAVVHGEGPLRISIGRHGDTVRVEVSDAALAVPKVQPPDLARTHGRGMAIVESFASRWGAQPLPGGLGKVVWFELHTGR